MSTERRNIPINHGAGAAGAGRAAAPGADNPAGGASNAAAAGGGHKSAEAAGGGTGSTPGQAAPPSGAAAGKGSAPGHAAQGASAPPAASAAAFQALIAERDALQAERDALAAERDALTDSALRLRAEFDNYRRRTSREVIDASTRAQCDVLGDMLPVLDNLDRALDAAEHHQEGKVLDGVRLTRKLFVDLLSCTGVEEIEGQGEPFDPTMHEAVMVQASDQPEGTVATVLQKGYRQGDRVLRPARVAVSAGNNEPAVAG